MAQVAQDSTVGTDSVPAGHDVALTPRRRDQLFLQVLEDVAASMPGESIEIDPGRQHGKPVVIGSRLPVSVVLTYLAAGRSLEQIADEFGDVTVEQLRGAVEYAAEVLDQDVGA
jgi:uncharacterized protein (DUF433 family)